MLIKNWLLEEGLSVKDFADESTDINYATKVGNIAIHLGFHKSSIDSVIVLGAIGLEPQERSMFRYTKTKREFMYDIELTFLQLNLDFIIDIPPTEQEFTIENIKLQKNNLLRWVI